MTGIAVLFLVISVVVVWGGLLVSVLHLRAHPTDDEDGVDRVDGDLPVRGGEGTSPRP